MRPPRLLLSPRSSPPPKLKAAAVAVVAAAAATDVVITDHTMVVDTDMASTVAMASAGVDSTMDGVVMVAMDGAVEDAVADAVVSQPAAHTEDVDSGDQILLLYRNTYIKSDKKLK